jgi:hypothetical protein
MIPTIVVERRLKEETTIEIQDGTTEIPQMIMMTREVRNTSAVEGDIPPLHHHLLTERKSADGHPHRHHRLRRGGRRGRGGTRRVRGGEGVTRGRGARGSIVMITKRRSIGHIDIIGMTHRIRVQVLLQLKRRNSRRGRRCPGLEVGPRKMTKNENIKKKE